MSISPKDLALLMNELNEVTDPYMLGINLGLDPSQVTIILKNAFGDIERQKSGVLEHWLKSDVNASWLTLVKSLKKIHYVTLACSLERKYKILDTENEGKCHNTSSCPCSYVCLGYALHRYWQCT